MWTSTVGLVNGKHRYLTAETFGFKINSNGQLLKRRQQWTIEPFPENLGPDGSVSSAASVSSQYLGPSQLSPQQQNSNHQVDPNDLRILTFSSGANGCSLTSIRSSNGSNSDHDNCSEEHENVAIKSHLNKYLAVDSFGNVTCDSDEKTENARFTISICSMSQGKSKEEHIFWAFRNVERGYYLGTTDDGMICCNAKMPKSRAELWHLHLLPARGASLFALKSIGRKRFARVASDDFIGYSGSDQNELNLGTKAQVQLDATISWGPETLFQFKYFEGGRYALLTSNCKYLTNEGKCVDWKAPNESSLPPAECLFTVEYHCGLLAFRDSFSHYLAAAGRSSVLRSRSIGVSRDELFTFESAPVQVVLKATFNNRWVSIKQGVDLTANQIETTSRFETFQLMFHKQTQNWSIMTHDCNFWTVSQNTSTVSVCKPGDYEALNRGAFQIVWSDSDATLSLKYIDMNKQERWISARKSGQLYLVTGNQAPVKFVMRFQNRTILNLRPIDGCGFVGLKAGSKQLEATKTSPDSIVIEYSDIPELANADTASIYCQIDPVERETSALIGTKSVNGSYEKQSNINIFNVRLNSTKMGQTILENNNGCITTITDHSKTSSAVQNNSPIPKEHDCCTDSNNNDETFNLDTENDTASKENGSVESASAPSVASIISSFSNARINNDSNGTPRTVQQQQQRVGFSVSRLASSFEGGAHTQLSDGASDTASVMTSCSSASNSSSVTSTDSRISASAGDQSVANKTSVLSEQLAQYECCYMKLVSNDRYLVAGEKSNVLCDATNKACAQPWVLELRSHNSIAIRASDNHAYLQLGTNGTMFLSRCDSREATLWEF